MTPYISAAVLAARRDRAVERAITRLCAHPSKEAALAVDVLRGAPPEYYRIADDSVWADRDDYVIDGVATERHCEALGLLRDRYGLTLGEAEAALIRARREAPAGHGGAR